MSAKRLREAADRLDEISIGWDGTPFPDRAATAALLRAVAKHRNLTTPICSYCRNYVIITGHDADCPWVAAQRLADTILGGSSVE